MELELLEEYVGDEYSREELMKHGFRSPQGPIRMPESVSYTHLDVYKRQATCCRECIRKWHKMQPGKELSQVQQDYLVDVIMTWIQKEPV